MENPYGQFNDLLNPIEGLIVVVMGMGKKVDYDKKP
jgi:hypothetical protein